MTIATLKARRLAAGDDGGLCERRPHTLLPRRPIAHDTPQVMDITRVSMAARAQVVVDSTGAEKALRLLMLKYPQQDSRHMLGQFPLSGWQPRLIE